VARPISVKNIASPYGLGLISYVVFLCAWVFPPGAYTEITAEPDNMFLDWKTFVFYTACVLAFFAGVWAMGRFGPPNPAEDPPPLKVSSPLLLLLGPLLYAIVFCGGFIGTVGNQIDVFGLLASQQGGLIKQAMHSGEIKYAVFGPAPLFTTGVIWWAWYMSRRLVLDGTERLIFRVVFFVTIVVDLAACIGTVDRTSLMPLLAGMMVIWADRKARVAGLTLSRTFLGAIGGGAIVVGTFLSLSFIRGFRGMKLLELSLMGYTVVSYNRLTALLNGSMHYQYGGKGAYLVQYMTTATKVNALLGLQHYWPSAADLWQSEFTSTLLAGLNPAFIWSGAFGYIYSELGWGALVYIALVGLFAGWAWARFHAGTILGRVLYPWIAFWILFWLGWNPLFANYFVNLLTCTAVIALHMYLFAPEALRNPLRVRPARRVGAARQAA